MYEFVQTRDGVVGQVKAKVRLDSGLTLGLDVSGNGDIFYAKASDCRPFNVAPVVAKTETKV